MAKEKKSNRSELVRSTLQQQNDDGFISDATPAERMGMVWQMTLDVWAFLDPQLAKSEFQRHVCFVKRGRG